MIDTALKRITSVFGIYPRPDAVTFCSFCCDADEIQYFQKSPLAAFDEDKARSLLVETADHWKSTSVYKHYLPVIFRRLAPPGHGDALYPAQLFETLARHPFAAWPAAERDAVARFMEAFLYELKVADDADAKEWTTC